MGYQRFTAEDRAAPSVNNTHMLLILAVSLHLNTGGLRGSERIRSNFIKLRLQGLQLIKNKRFVLGNQLTAIHLDLKTVSAAGIAGRSYKYTGRTVLIFYISGNIVFNLNIMPLAIVQMRMDLDWHAADPLPQVQLMGALIQQHAAAFPCPGSTPCAGIIISLGAVPVGNDPVRTANTAVLAGIHQLLHLAVDVVRALIKHHAVDDIGVLFCSFVHFHDLLGVNACRLFHHHMNAPLHARYSQPGMIIVRYGNDTGIDQAAVQQSLCAVEESHIRAQVFLCPVFPFFLQICNSSKNKVGTFALHRALCVSRAHITNTNNAKSDFLFHNVISSFKAIGF